MHTIEDYTHAVNSGIKFKFETNLVETMATARSSCETSWSSTYSHNLRWWIVWQREALNLSVWEVRGILCVDPPTVSRITALFRATGDIAKKPYQSKGASEPLDQFFVIYLTLNRPGIYLSEVKLKLQIQLTTSQSALCKFLHKTGFTKQRLFRYHRIGLLGACA